jgi:hypothetical protein
MTTRVDPRHGTVTIDLPAPVDVVAAVIHGVTASFPGAIIEEGPPDVLIIRLNPEEAPTP